MLYIDTRTQTHTNTMGRHQLVDVIMPHTVMQPAAARSSSSSNGMRQMVLYINMRCM